MKAIDLDKVEQFVNDHIVTFHQAKIRRLEQLKLNDLLKRKNPYLFKAKNILVASDLVEAILGAYLSSSEEKLFGDFLEELAIFIAGQTLHGYKSTAPGIDLEFDLTDTRYLVSIKSGPNWGNSAQHRKLEDDFGDAVKRLKQSKSVRHVQPVLGICYGNSRTTNRKNYMRIVGQNFWAFIGGSKQLYTDIIEPLGYRAKEHNENFEAQKAQVINRFTMAFSRQFCSESGAINWVELVQFNSGNFDLEDFEHIH